MGLSDAQAKRMEFKELKEQTRKLTKMEEDRPKLYGLMMQHMSLESKDEVSQDPDYVTWHTEKDPEKLWQAIIRTHKVDCLSYVDAIKELAARKAYQSIKQGSFDCTRQQEQKKDQQVLDFFHGLDQGKCAVFKSSMLNGWATKALKPPETVNNIYRIAGNWVKPSLKPEGETAASFVNKTQQDLQIAPGGDRKQACIP